MLLRKISLRIEFYFDGFVVLFGIVFSSVSSAGRNRRHIVRDLESELVRDGVGAIGANEFVSAEVEKSSGVLPTMWLGAQSGRQERVYIVTLLFDLNEIMPYIDVKSC